MHMQRKFQAAVGHVHGPYEGSSQDHKVMDRGRENKERDRTCVRKGQQDQVMQNLYTRVGSLDFVVSA